MLSAIGRYHYISVAQLMRLLDIKSKSFVQMWLADLVAGGYAKNENWLQDNPTGSPAHYWSITQKGRNALQIEGRPYAKKVSHRDHRSVLFLKHVRDLNDLLINCELLPKKHPGVELTGFRHDLDLQRFPTRFPLTDGRIVSFVPDGWVAFGIGEIESCLCVEMDRGHEDEKQWREKIRCYVSFAQKPYQEAFNKEALIVAVVAKVEEGILANRVANLIRWTEIELRELGKPNWGTLFRFTSVNPAETDARIFFGAPHWQQPFETAKKPLLEGVL